MPYTSDLSALITISICPRRIQILYAFSPSLVRLISPSPYNNCKMLSSTKIDCLERELNEYKYKRMMPSYKQKT